MANAYVSVVGSQIWDRNTTKMGADSRTDQHFCISCLAQNDLGSLIQDSLFWILVFLLMDFSLGQSPNKNWGPIPDNLQNFSWRQVRNINFHIGISMITSPPVHSSNSSNNKESCNVEPSSKQNSTKGIHLCSSNIGFVFIMGPIFLKPIIDVNFEINMISEIAWSGGGGEELCFFRDEMGAIHFNIGSSVVLRNEAKGCFISQFYESEYLRILLLLLWMLWLSYQLNIMDI